MSNIIIGGVIMKYINSKALAIFAIVTTLFMSGCAMSNSQKGALAGASVGGLAGSMVGNSKTAVVGAAAGAVVGGIVGKEMDN